MATLTFGHPEPYGPSIQGRPQDVVPSVYVGRFPYPLLVSCHQPTDDGADALPRPAANTTSR
jgi:hypothetical protein